MRVLFESAISLTGKSTKEIRFFYAEMRGIEHAAYDIGSR
jgi:hypothetical protein